MIHGETRRRKEVIQMYDSSLSLGITVQNANVRQRLGSRIQCHDLQFQQIYTDCPHIALWHNIGILCPSPRLGAEWIGRISWLPRAPLGPIFMIFGPKGALGSHEIHPIHSAQSLGQSIVINTG